MTLPRVVEAETLDHLLPDDPAAMRSRRDLVRVHRAMGTRSILIRELAGLVSSDRATKPLQILELGAGDGTLLLALAGALKPRWPSVQLTLLDRQRLVTPATLAGYTALGWEVDVLVTDIIDWAGESEAKGSKDTKGAPAQRWDLILTTLFLHHFEPDALGPLLAAVAARSDRFLACEPHRSGLALLGSHLIGAIGANAVTRQDAVLSVHAGFRGNEISALWPLNAGTWRLREAGAGLFSHCFSAQRSAEER